MHRPRPPPFVFGKSSRRLLMTGYAGYYLCRSDLSVALPLLIQEMASRGIPLNEATTRLRSIASLGVLAYAIGKFPSGGLADFLGGRRNFLLGMAGSVLFTFVFAASGGIPMFTLAWIGNRGVQSMGWAGVVKITSKWFSFSTYGTAMGVMSLSYLFRDAASRQLARRLLLGGRGFGGAPTDQPALCERVAPGERPSGTPCEPLESLRTSRRAAPPAQRQIAAGDFRAQPRVLAGLHSFAGHDARARDVQPVDTDLLHARRRIGQCGRRRQERSLPTVRRNLGAALRNPERPAG